MILYLYFMKRCYLLILTVVITQAVNAGIFTGNARKVVDTNQFAPAFKKVPEYPGGMKAFSRYISKNLKYPDIANLVGINGKVYVSFVINQDGKVIEVTPVSCIGAGCESEAVRIIENSKQWTPGLLDGRPVRVQYTVPIDFNISKEKVRFNDLKSSAYGFVFNIKGVLYSIDEAKIILGRSFTPDQVEIAEPFFNYNNDPKFIMPDKKDVYLIIIKSS